MNAFEQLKELWDELIIDHFYCKHEECLHRDCMYHMHSTKPNYFSDDDMPSYMPKNNKDLKSCKSYMDIKIKN